ncbi:MAG: penicillin acylase family protein [Actinomycetota bacterium]
MQGSNNWAVSGEKSRSGKPILCCDPHSRQSIPTAFYLCHLKAEEESCDMIGASLPGMPGIIMGRNRSIAWSATSLGTDAVDLYIETFEERGSRRYLAGEDWREAELVEEVVRVFPGRRVKHEVLITRHGPVVAREEDKGLALKWVGHDPDNDSAGCFVRMGLAGSWEEFRLALKGYSGPGLNLVYADLEGNIGYCAAARIPLREGHDGSVPLPGKSNSYEWKGYAEVQEMLHVLNPGSGWVATANNQIADDKCPYNLTTMWQPSCRQERIAELLAAENKLGVDDMRSIQSDLQTCHGGVLRREMMLAAEGREDLSPRILQALDILGKWGGRAEVDSAAQSIYYLTWKVLTERLLRHRLGHDLYFHYVTSFCNVNHAVGKILAEKRQEWLPAYADDYQQLLLQCLEEALRRLEARFETPDMSSWEWGKMHSLEVPHFLGAFWPLNRFLNLGPVRRPGDGETVCAAMPESDPAVQVRARSAAGGSSAAAFAPRFYSDRAYAGPVLKMIIDLADAESSLWCLDVGQSSHPLSRYYVNFFDMWRDNRYIPMAFSPKKIEETAVSRLKLVPE